MYIDLAPLIKQLEPKPEVGVNPTLAILKYGEHKDSSNYIKGIEKKARKFRTKLIVQDLKDIENIESKIIEVQELTNAILPINPFHGKLNKIVKNKLDPVKDVDNFTGKSLFNKCTAEAVLEILKYQKIGIKQKITIVGSHVGMDIYNVLLKEGYNPKVVNRETQNIEECMKNADVIVSCTGVKGLIKKNMIKIGATVIDVGLGDVDEGVAEIADVTTVRDGVGAVTTAVLFKHIFTCVAEEETWIV